MIKKLAVLFINFCVFSNLIFSQEADLIHVPENKEELESLQTLINTAVGGEAKLLVNDVQISTTPSGFSHNDLYCNVYVRLFYEKTDASSATLQEEVSLPLNLLVKGTKNSTQIVETTIIDTVELVVSPEIDQAEAVYHFSKNQLSDLNLHTITEGEVNFLTSHISYLDTETLSQLTLELYFEFGRYENEISVPSPKTKYSNEGAPDLKANEVMIVWDDNALPKPVTYELEWIHVPNENLNANSLAIDFSKNAVRVQTKNNYYPISTVYEGGYIVSRVRGIRNLTNDDQSALITKKEYFPWGIDNSVPHIDMNVPNEYTNNPAYYSVLNLNQPFYYNGFDHFNWQYTNTYATEGKKKEVLQFFDGSKRNRQQLTLLTENESPRNFQDKLNNNFPVNHNTTLIAKESYYDHNGEVVLEILPSPLVMNYGNGTIGYQENINLHNDQKLAPSLYDSKNSLNFPVPLDEIAQGASRYYSPSNELANPASNRYNPISAFIPDAEGYPYQRKVYMNDGSGRLKAEYGPGGGIANDPDGTKNTRYFYSKPTQSELDYLFGTNVGEARFYKKDITVDPNGVISMAYIDQKDRTVATSIAGAPNDTSKMDSIQSYNIQIFTEDLLTAGDEKFVERNNSYELQYPIFVPVDGNYTFDYSIDMNTFNAFCNPLANLCYTCTYMFSFQIIDERGSLVAEEVDEDVVIGNLNCNSESEDLLLNLSPVALLGGKKYTVIKTLRLVTDNIDSQVDYHINNSACVDKDLEFFINQELENAPFEQCETEFEDPCAYVRNAMRDDFRYPTGAFVKNAPLDAKVVEYILMRTRREVNCSSTLTSSSITENPTTPEEEIEKAYREEIISRFVDEFDDITEQPTFANFKEEYIDFFLDYHPSYCKLYTCELFNSKESMMFDAILENSETIEQFEDNMKAINPQLPSTAISFDEVNDIIKTYTTPIDMESNTWHDRHFSNYNHPDPNDDHLVQFYSDFALLAFDESFFSNLRWSTVFSSDYAGSSSSKNIGIIEKRNYPLYKQCYLQENDQVNWSWNNPDSLWGVGSYKSFGDRMYLLGSYLTYYTGCSDQRGINQVAYEAYPGTTATDKEKRWNLYKKLYINAKHSFIQDFINYSSCDPRKDRFWTTDSNAGDIIPSGYEGYDEGYGGQWHWDRWYDWGEWWTNSTNCDDIYLGTEPENAQSIHDDLANINDNPAPGDISDSIKKDLVNLIKGSELSASCKNSAVTAIDVPSFDGILFIESNNPYIYLDNWYPSGSCGSVYMLNLSTVITPYLRYFKDKSNNYAPYFSRSLPENPQVNCEDISDAITSYPAGLTLPVLLDGYSDIDRSDFDQMAFKNYMNAKFGLNLAFADYFELVNSCTYLSAPHYGQTPFMNSISSIWGGFSGSAQAIKVAMINFSTGTSADYWIQDPELDLYDKMDILNVSTADLDPNQDYLGFGTLGYDNFHQDMFFLDNKRTKYNNLKDTMSHVFTAIKSELDNHPDFENSYSATAIVLNIAQGTSVGGGTNLKIDRAVRQSNGTIWVRLLNNSDEYYNDYYYHYRPHNYQGEAKDVYLLSELTGSFSGFTEIEPIFHDESMHYVWLENASYRIMASTAKEIAKAHRLGKVELNDVDGANTLPLMQSCEDLLYEEARLNGRVKYEEYMENQRRDFKQALVNHCTNRNIGPAFTQHFSMEYTSNERHFTLYYYDQADNLVMTVPPDGVDVDFNYNSNTKQQIKNYRNGASSTTVVPQHEKKTIYKYNADNQIIEQITPNGGKTNFWYDRVGRLILSQNANQACENKFSYTLYDEQSRIEETGVAVFSHFNGMNWTQIRDEVTMDPDPQNTNYFDFKNYVKTLAVEREHVIKTFYDTKILTTNPTDFNQKNLRSRVSTQAYYTAFSTTTNNNQWDYATHYSYDPVGNVKTLLNDYQQKDRITNEGDRFKRIDYSYDPVSGNVLRVYYQLGKNDAFYHRYEYDAENRITKVETSRDGLIWDEDADYKYYMHGPLARIDLGEQNVQRLDYAYTLQGWVKSVNSGVHGEDMGDVYANNDLFGKDAFGYSLQYYDGDYTPIGGSGSADHLLNHSNPDLANLYNGNISAQSVHNQEGTIARSYTYDQLNRIKAMQEYTLSGNSWGQPDQSGYYSTYDYDGNGNLTELQRYNGQEASVVDNMSYSYISGTDQLDHVSDVASSDSYFEGDFDGQASGNYDYDKIGNLTKDVKAEVKTIEWYPNGKIKRVERENPTAIRPDLAFQYDALGNRVKKTVSFVEDGRYFLKSTYYVRDAQGNVMATYDERGCGYNDADGKAYYQFSHDFEYYTLQALNEVGVNNLLNFLNGTFSRKTDLLAQAKLHLNDIPNIKNLIWPYLDVEDYLTMYPEAKDRILEEESFYFADYLYNNNQSQFINIANENNEAWIQALKTHNLIQSFYNSINGYFFNDYNQSERLYHISTFYQMKKQMFSNLISQNPSLFMEMLGINSAQFDIVESIYNDPGMTMQELEQLLQELYGLLEAEDGGSHTEELIRTIHAILFVASFDDPGALEGLLSMFDMQIFYDALSWLDPQLAEVWQSVLGHFYVLDEGGIIDIQYLTNYLPMNGIYWSFDSNGSLLDYFLLKNFANPSIISLVGKFFNSVNMTNSDIYFSSASTVRNYVLQALLRNSGLAFISNAIVDEDNVAVSKAALYETEDLANLLNYFKSDFPYETLMLNLNYDNLSAAFKGLSNYSPADYAEELMTQFPSLSFETPNNCTANYTLEAESFEIYGSSRLGIMDAKSKRQDGDNLFSRKLGGKQYELVDHLGNVVATVSDKKLHPQDLEVNGEQTADPNIGFQADVTGRYDRFPFGMEILERSGDYSVINYNQNGEEMIYNGLLNSCSDYAVNNSTKNCTESTNLYNNNYVSSISVTENLGLGFSITPKLRLSQIIPNLDEELTYRIEVMVNASAGRNVSASIGGHSGIISSPSAGAGASPSQITSASDKLVSFEISGENIQNIATNNRVNVNLSISAGTGMMYSSGASIDYIKVSKKLHNSSVPMARRKEKAYRYGFQGQEVDNEWAGVAFGGGEIPVWEDDFDPVVPVLNDEFVNSNNWNIGNGNYNIPCASTGTYNGEDVLIMDSENSYCSAKSNILYLVEGKRYRLDFDVEKPTSYPNNANNTFVIRWERYNESNDSWDQSILHYIVPDGRTQHTHYHTAGGSGKYRMSIFSPDASDPNSDLLAYVYSISIKEELGDWDVWNRGDGEPNAIIENGRIKLQNTVSWGGATYSDIPVNNKGELHTITFDAERLNLPNTLPTAPYYSYVIVRERNAGGSWENVPGGRYTISDISSKTEVSREFTPSKDYIQVYITSSGNNYPEPIEFYVDNIKITDGTTEDVIDGGIGNKVAFKYRIQDVSIGRFLSVDPLAAEYAWNSPYAFSENRVIDGIDLEGLEYFDGTAKLMMINGVVALNPKNLSNPTLNRIRNSGTSTIVSKLDYSKLMMFERTPTSNDHLENKTTQNPNIRIVLPNSNGHKVVNLSTGGSSKSFGRGVLVAEAVGKLSETIQNFMVQSDINGANEQMSAIKMVNQDMHTASQRGMIPSEFSQNERALSNIANFVLNGELANPLREDQVYTYKNGDEFMEMDAASYNQQLEKIGQSIIDNVSNEREQ